MSTAILPTTSDINAWSDDEKAVIEAAGLVFVHSYGANKGEKILAPRPVVAKFLHTCERTGLDPLARQIYCIGRFGSDGLEWSIQTSIDGFRVIGERSRQYAGQDPAEWLTSSGEWVTAFIKGLHGDHPLAARVKVWRHDWPDRPMTAIATWDEYAQTKRNGDLTAMWAQRGPGQLAKCAEALAFRKAFPQDLSGIYTDEEMDSRSVEVADADGEAPRRRGLPTLASRARAAEEQAAAAVEPEAVDADEVPAEVQPEFVDVELFPCSRCGSSMVEDAGGICEPCEVEVEAEIAAGGEQS